MIHPGDFTDEALSKIAPVCAECNSAKHVGIAYGNLIYPNRRDLWSYDDGSERFWWRCSACGAYVGVHRYTLKALGTPAGPETRAARARAHAAFDPLWRKRMRLSGLKQNKARSKGYVWLAEQLGIDAKDCHIGMLTAEQADAVVRICTRRND